MLKRQIFYLVFFLLFAPFVSKSQETNKQYTSFINVLKEFIASSKKASLYNGRNNVYYLKLYSTDLDTNSYGYALSYWYNYYDFEHLEMQYIFDIDSDIVLMNTDSFHLQKWIGTTNYVVVDSIGKQRIKKK